MYLRDAWLDLGASSSFLRIEANFGGPGAVRGRGRYVKQFPADLVDPRIVDHITAAGRLNRNRGLRLDAGSIWAEALRQQQHAAYSRAMTCRLLPLPDMTPSNMPDVVAFDEWPRAHWGIDPAAGQDAISVAMTSTVESASRADFGVDQLQEAMRLLEHGRSIREAMRRRIDSLLADALNIPVEWQNALVPPLSDQEQARRDEQQAVERKEAYDKGMALLKRHLSPQQLADYERTCCFDVTGSESGRTYRIRHGKQQNIYLMHASGRPEMGLCFLPQLPDGSYPVEGDCMLAQKLTLELDEAEALRIALKYDVGFDRVLFMSTPQRDSMLHNVLLNSDNS